MLKILTAVLTSYYIVQVQSCSKSQSESWTVSSCPEREYMKPGNRSVISEYPDNLKIVQLAIAGTRKSMSVELDPNLQTQEMNIGNQLDCGVRALEISVSPLFNVFRLRVDKIFLNDTFVNLLRQINDFLEKNPREIVFLIVNHAESHFDETKCNGNCDAFDHYANDEELGSRLVTEWSLDDTVKNHRGSILVGTNSEYFQNDVFYLNSQCMFLEDKESSAGDKDDAESLFEYKWSKYVELTKNRELEHHRCFVYDLSLNISTPLIRRISKYGGYFYKNKCIEPMNYRFSNYHSENRQFSLRMYFLEFITQEAIDYINNQTVVKI